MNFLLTTLLVCVLFLFPVRSHAETADYVGFREHAKKVISFVASGKSCESLGAGFEIAYPDAQEISDSLISYAIRKGIDKTTAETLMLGIFKEQKNNYQHLSEYYKEHPEKAFEYGEYWGELCYSFSVNDETKEYIKYNEQ